MILVPKRLFVYGTLRPTWHDNALLGSHTEVEASVTVQGALWWARVGDYPVAKFGPSWGSEGLVVGDLIVNPDPWGFERVSHVEEGAGYELVDVVTTTGIRVSAFLYKWDTIEELRIPDGDWLKALVETESL